MPQDTRNPLSIFIGQKAQARLITRSHGLIRPNLMDSFNFTPKLSNKEIPEFDNPVNALTYTTFDGGTGKIGYTESNQGQINAALMDLDPTVAVQMLNAAFYQPFDMFVNFKGLDGLIKGSALLYSCTATGSPFDQAVKEAAKRTLDFTCLNGIMFPGLALQYTRARGATAQVAPPAAVTLATSNTGGFLTADTYYIRTTAVTAAGESTPGPESAIHVPTGTATNKITVTTPAVAGSILSYNIYMFNRSNGERFAANTVVTATDILVMPSATAAALPLFNTSGVFAVLDPQDKIFTGAGPYTTTLPTAAYYLAQTGLPYAMVKRNGALIATPDNPATQDTFLFSADGSTFSVNANPAAEWWDLLTLYQP